ncbi:hypothetical protein FEV53_12465 [Palleronia caenipelagi]|uniref:Uncharacterized protein n=2 Tax=Palleronia caenipelagi TaxID=2489174 RepID=A0A547PUF8_9RHOB|nr:hypothetical protein FEV53_12465 [Palleronia caenipelagi]
MIRDVFGPDVELVIPPPGNAISGDCATRNVHIQMNADHGRIAWQKSTGYVQRSRVEAQIDRYKQVIGPALRGRNMECQTTEPLIAIEALNRMTDLGRAAYERVICSGRESGKCALSLIYATRSGTSFTFSLAR